jgi:hypothetical protein
MKAMLHFKLFGRMTTHNQQIVKARDVMGERTLDSQDNIGRIPAIRVVRSCSAYFTLVLQCQLSIQTSLPEIRYTRPITLPTGLQCC